MLFTPDTSRPASFDDLLDPALAARLDALDIRSRKIFRGKLQGERRSKKRGQSVEFDDYRDYTPGDDLRHIDWNVYARFDRLFIKLFLEEEDLALHLAVDASASMHAGRPTKAFTAARLAAALAYIGLINNNRVSINVFGRAQAPGEGEPEALPILSLQRLGDLRGRRHVPRVLQFLISSVWGPPGLGPSVAPGKAANDFNSSLTALARSRTGKGVMVLLSDFLIAPEDGGYEPGLRALAAGSGAGGFDLWCLQILSPGEADPQSELDQGLAGDLRLTDVESGRASEVTMTAALIKQYKRRLEQYCDALHSFCLHRAIEHQLVRSDAALDSLLLETLRRRGMLG